ncbi:MAG TPA: glycosyltransferase [Gaiellaceae bacterium]|nr:glycosyltransferase [Gaiellaceae bacterium]
MVEGPKTVAVMTDLWPSASRRWAGAFVRGQLDALAGDYRQLVLVPRLLLPSAHRRIWGDDVAGWERGWAAAPESGRLLRYPTLRVPKAGETRARALGALAVLAAHRERPALVHGHFLRGVGTAAQRVARRLDVPVVLTVHGTDGRWLVGGGIQERHRREMVAAVRGADRVLVVEQGLADQVAEAAGVAGERLRVIPMGVDEQVFRPGRRAEARRRLGLPEDGRIVVFVGLAAPAKGIDVLDRALREVDATAVAVGTPGTGERIRFVGEHDPAGVAEWLAAADVFCLPSLAEGMPVSVMEALASGRPVVATRVGGIPDQVEDGVTGLLVPPGDSDALADALRRALDRSWDEQAIRAASERFWWSRIAPRIAAVYAELL